MFPFFFWVSRVSRMSSARNAEKRIPVPRHLRLRHVSLQSCRRRIRLSAERLTQVKARLRVETFRYRIERPLKRQRSRKRHATM